MSWIMQLSTKVGRKIAALRTERDWNQTELGTRVGVGRMTISRIESGKKQTTDILDAIATAFGLDGAEELITLARDIPDESPQPAA